MKRFVHQVTTVLSLVCASALAAADLGKSKVAVTPPMGWTSDDAFGFSMTKAEFLANAAYVKERLLSFGYDTVPPEEDAALKTNLSAKYSVK